MSIALSLGNNLTTNGVFKPAAVNNTSVNNVTTFASVPAGGALFLLSTQTASSSASIEFTSGIDSTYDSYVFKFINMHPADNDRRFVFNGSTDGGSNYNVTKTTTAFYALHNEAGSSTSLSYHAGLDLAQSTDFQSISNPVGNDNDQCACIKLTLFNPSSTAYVKHFIITANSNDEADSQVNHYFAGYFNSTSAINALKFQMNSGDIGSGTIKMYGISA